MTRTEKKVAAFAGVLTVVGYFLPLHLYLTPKKDLGYALGWAGAIMMTLLFLYSIKKRATWGWLERTPILRKWFDIHMLFGIFGPISILYHCGYQLGATNSNMALWSMIIVAISGFIGRFLYHRTGWEILFKWWHIVHLPFVGMLVLTAIIHIFSTFYY
jgi:hypothetical protein